MDASTTPSRLQRTACDRCRSQKLKCLRDEDKPSCSSCRRCLRIGHPCTTGAARKAGRPSTKLNDIADLTSIIDPSLRTPTSTARNTPSSTSAHHDIFSTSQPSQTADNSRLPTPGANDYVSLLERRSQLMRKLGELSHGLHLDVDALRGCRTIDQCKTLPGQTFDDVDPAFFVSRLLNSGKLLLEIALQFRFTHEPTSLVTQTNTAITNSNETITPSPEAKTSGVVSVEEALPRLDCDIAVLLSIGTSFVMLVRLFRVILWTLLDSLPIVRAPNYSPANHNFKNLFHGLTLGEYSLEGRMDLQMLFLVQASEDLIERLELALGIPEATIDRLSQGEPVKAAEVVNEEYRVVLMMLLAREAKEQPPMDMPRGHCGTLREIVRSLRGELAPNR
ncbi:uncharacterized protein AB675_1625 [Cyphellophora attinorum]|uniref:Zn(2)-C6 fungal-type domain-containing protein n=1 Tax=Cyphellophora attinorum TaxID=1664694 RepID=A0A0N1H4B5_9EURO|nr:uncharacterized protein AB675_1625 [Phialophora attinorum]KPI36020.1 hypothetical protein AB675_1625 [Phialophora attinorum]